MAKQFEWQMVKNVLTFNCTHTLCMQPVNFDLVHLHVAHKLHHMIKL